MHEEAWKTHMEATVGRLDHSHLETVGVLKDMKQMLMAMATSTQSPHIGSPTSNPPNSPAAMVGQFPRSHSTPRNNEDPVNPNDSRRHLTPSVPVVQPMTLDRPQRTPNESTPTSTLPAPEFRPVAPAANNAPPSPPLASNNVELGEDDLSSDPDFMTQVPRTRVTRSRASPPPSPVKRKVQRKYLKSKTPVHDVPPVQAPIHGRMSPRDKDAGPIACNKPCWVLHLDFPTLPIAYGKSGISWKSKSKNLQYTPCDQGQQMVQIHFVYEAAAPLMYFEPDRQPFRTVLEAKVPQCGSGVYVKWATHLLVRDNASLDGNDPKP